MREPDKSAQSDDFKGEMRAEAVDGVQRSCYIWWVPRVSLACL